jgi:hypothetical protein
MAGTTSHLTLGPNAYAEHAREMLHFRHLFKCASYAIPGLSFFWLTMTILGPSEMESMGISPWLNILVLMSAMAGCAAGLWIDPVLDRAGRSASVTKQDIDEIWKVIYLICLSCVGICVPGLCFKGLSVLGAKIGSIVLPTILGITILPLFQQSRKLRMLTRVQPKPTGVLVL